jgi:tRNA dimethylallyltransferase
VQDVLAELIKQKTCLAIMGPTACGKSQLSMALAKTLEVEIISVDSALIYKGMDIGTAKPSINDRDKVPHHLIDIIEPTDSYSAAEFVADAHKLVIEIFARNRLPVFVGGTMMYFNALQKGMAKLPSADNKLRAKIFANWQQDAEKTHKQLAKIDPQAAVKIHFNDSQRIVRALEVFQLTGKSISQLQTETQNTALKDFKLKKIALLPEDRAQIHQKIATRLKTMLEQGFLSEVSKLMANEQLDADSSAMRSVGYRQAWLHLLGEYDYDSFADKAIIATRQLAKRQVTWLRKEEGLVQLDPYKKSIAEQLVCVELLLNS